MSKRIVLVDPSGDILFSGESVATQPPPAAFDDVRDELDDEPCPETLRSPIDDSGVFPAVKSIRVRGDYAGEHERRRAG